MSAAPHILSFTANAPTVTPKPPMAVAGTGLQAAPDHEQLRTFLGIERPLAIADIGAADYGEANAFEDLARHGFAKFYGFEPDETCFNALQAKRTPRQTFLPYALGDGRAHKLHICPAGMTSLLEPDPAALAFFNGFEQFGKVDRVIEIPTRRLEEMDEVDPLHFLKIDVQGSELMILENGGSKLSELCMAHIEVSFITLYKNQPTFGEIDLFMRSKGFVPHHMFFAKNWIIAPTVIGGDFRRPLNQILEADVVYMRDVIHAETLDDDTLRRTAYLAEVVYDSLDLSIRCILELAKRGRMPEGSHLAYAQAYGERREARRRRAAAPR